MRKEDLVKKEVRSLDTEWSSLDPLLAFNVTRVSLCPLPLRGENSDLRSCW